VFWIAFILFVVSLLAVFKPPFYQAWLVSVAVAGLPWFFALISLGVFLAGLFGMQAAFSLYPAATLVFAGASFLLYAAPIAAAFRIAARLPERMERVLELPPESGKRTLPAPFRFRRMITDPLKGNVPFQTMPYCSESLTLDFYASRTNGRCPCILVIHGGSWSSGHSRQLPELNGKLARAGYHVAAINYRLAPGFTSPLPVEDVGNAVDFLRQHAYQLRIAPDQFVLLGRSAGGQIALQAAYTSRDPGIRGVIAFYAPADMVWGYSAPASRLVMDSRKVMEMYLGGSYPAVPEMYHGASPLEAVAGHAVPTLLIHGKNDVLVSYEHSVRLEKALHARNTPCYLLGLPFGTHGFDYVPGGPEGQLAAYAVHHFLRFVTKRT